mmetsp:Transcript_68117/g.141328  ORF Transcript_68117/g.141328 Transcript_68117/m.141328 type:complete len:192 (+) Transcript_68117:56-631(+)
MVREGKVVRYVEVETSNGEEQEERSNMLSNCLMWLICIGCLFLALLVALLLILEAPHFSTGFGLRPIGAARPMAVDPAVGCYSDPYTWTADLKSLCCTTHNIGCQQHFLARPHSTGTAAVEAEASRSVCHERQELESWSAGQQVYCCETYRIGCSAANTRMGAEDEEFVPDFLAPTSEEMAEMARQSAVQN